MLFMYVIILTSTQRFKSVFKIFKLQKKNRIFNATLVRTQQIH